MNKQFEFELGTGELIDVEICITAKDPDNSGAEYFYESILSKDGGPIELSLADMERMAKRSQKYADDNADLAHQEYIEGESDRVYESNRDESHE
jgi:hypothetical protein